MFVALEETPDLDFSPFLPNKAYDHWQDQPDSFVLNAQPRKGTSSDFLPVLICPEEDGLAELSAPQTPRTPKPAQSYLGRDPMAFTVGEKPVLKSRGRPGAMDFPVVPLKPPKGRLKKARPISRFHEFPYGLIKHELHVTSVCGYVRWKNNKYMSSEIDSR